MRVLINGIPLLSPRTGIGNYIYHLGSALAALAGAEQIRFFYGAWIGGLRASGPLPVEGARRLGRTHDLAYRARHALAAVGLSLAKGLRRFDLYHETGLVPYWNGRPKVMTIFDLSLLRYPHLHPAPRVRYFHDRFLRQVPSVDQFLTISEFVRQEIVQTLGIPERRVTVTRLGVDPSYRPWAEEEAQPILDRLGLRFGRYLLGVGTREPRKNLANLFAAYQSLPADTRREYPLVHVGGSGWSEPDVPVGPGIIQAGYLPDPWLPALYSGAKALVFPSYYEGFGLPVLEAMSCGCPVITSQGSAMVEVTGTSALAIDPRDPGAIAQAMERLCRDPALGERLSREGLARAGGFSWDRCARATLGVYAQLAPSA